MGALWRCWFRRRPRQQQRGAPLPRTVPPETFHRSVRLTGVKISIALGILAVCAVIFATNCASHVGFAVAGGPPVCPYGYYEGPPYNCAPDGYYGPEWFSGGVFLGAGPWFHGPRRFYGHVDHALDYREGYHGSFPARGERPAERRAEFHGQAMHDFRGHEAPAGRR